MSAPADWLRLAGDDLRIARWAFDEAIYHQACFHAQQCAEKAVKAWLIHASEFVPRTHQLSVLVALVPEGLVTGLAIRLLVLDRFYIPTRYPDALPGTLDTGLPNQADAAEAVAVAHDALAAIQRALSLSGGSEATGMDE